MPKLTIYRGLPGSGKSYHAQFVQGNNEVIVERDQLRQELFGTWFTDNYAHEQQVTKVQRKRVTAALRAGIDVRVPDMHLKDKYVREWLLLAHDIGGVEVSIEDFRTVPLEKVLKQNKHLERESVGKVVPELLIQKMHRNFIAGKSVEQLLEPRGAKVPADQIIYPYEQGNGYPAIIVDIDGTVADMDGQRSPYDYSKVHLDKPKQDVIDILDAAFVDGANVYFVSGRKSECREATEAWLREHIPFPYEGLYMRADGDDREDSIIKYELFNAHIRPLGHRIIGVFDDRHRVLRMWRKLGLTTFHVNGPDAGDF